ncbi:hypothetical protein IWQ57_002064 [Coemansia nantahalensis]|nr:hypothetical protein IWQ57_002064 [Coemansia nantahalensis]
MKRRKMLARIVKDWDPAHLALLDECDIDPTLRPQDVPTERLCRFAQVIEERAIRLP